jgi:hypothetical protein
MSLVELQIDFDKSYKKGREVSFRSVMQISSLTVQHVN